MREGERSTWLAGLIMRGSKAYGAWWVCFKWATTPTTLATNLRAHTPIYFPISPPMGTSHFPQLNCSFVQTNVRERLRVCLTVSNENDIFHKYLLLYHKFTFTPGSGCGCSQAVWNENDVFFTLKFENKTLLKKHACSTFLTFSLSFTYIKSMAYFSNSELSRMVCNLSSFFS